MVLDLLGDGTPLSGEGITPMYLQAMESFGYFGRGTTQAQVLGDLLRMVINHVFKSWEVPPRPQDAGLSPPGTARKHF